MQTPRPMPYCARWGGVEVIEQFVRPGRGHFAHAGEGGGIPDRQTAPAVAVPRTAWRQGGHWTGKMPRLCPVFAHRGGGGATWRWRRTGSCHFVLNMAGWSPTGRQAAPVVAGSRMPGRGEGAPHRLNGLALAGPCWLGQCLASRPQGHPSGRGRERAGARSHLGPRAGRSSVPRPVASRLVGAYR